MPWWTLLPGRAKLVLLPFGLAWFAVWLTAKLVRFAWYYPVTATAFLLGQTARVWLGPWVLGGLVVVLVLAQSVWWWRDHETHARWLRWARTEYRRAVVYASQWRTVVRLSNLTGTAGRREHLPRLKRVRSEGWRDRVRVRMVRGQAPEQWEARASGLAHSFGSRSCRVRVVRPGVLELDLVHSDPLAASVPLPALGATETDLRRVIIGRTEMGKPWRLRLLGSHILTVGVTGAGKGSLLWSMLWQLAPMVKAGAVRLVGVDPKGGMELGQVPELFDRVAYDNGEAAVTLLESVAVEVRERAASYRGLRRLWARETGEPFTLLVIDELADLIAYQTDKRLKERAQAALQTITSQGRAPGFGVLAFVQDPRKEVVPFRNLFPTRVAMRLDEHTQVDMVLGDGVRARGATAHEIPESTPGVAWVKVDGQRDPVRARAFEVTDGHLVELRHYIVGTSATIVHLPSREPEEGAAA
ncbi:FtsK/SpoIIIE domain-containing protein [Actinokineospora globicatena]|uniref:FtsK/SpoIIIE domain-containing protein n=1 Tax=Actinokineospora globicatena TaxID=103729 RepID=UPI0027E22C39|nr:FtsK/SpoIIIE domain-containing protein [Actinokineospora globicatena]